MRLIVSFVFMLECFSMYAQVESPEDLLNSNDPFKLPKRSLEYNPEIQYSREKYNSLQADYKYISSVKKAMSAPHLVEGLFVFEVSEEETQFLKDSILLFTSLRYLYVMDSVGEWLPHDLGFLPKLSFLMIKGACLSNLPKSVKDSKTIESISIEGTFDPADIPEWLRECESLESLDISKCGLTKVPQNVLSLSKLKRLDLSENKLTSLPVNINKMRNLEELILIDNKIKTLPSNLYKLKSLKVLDLRSNNIMYLDSGLARISQLAQLNLYENPIKDFPLFFANSQSLKLIFLDESLPKTIKKQAKKIQRRSDIEVHYVKSIYEIPLERNRGNNGYRHDYLREVEQRSYNNWVNSTVNRSHPAGF